jgi:hypothetical protein
MFRNLFARVLLCCAVVPIAVGCGSAGSAEVPAVPDGGFRTQNLPRVVVSISPSTANAAPGGTLHFTATVTGSSDTGVTWSADGGTMQRDGTWQAPPSSGTFSVTAVAHADSTKTAQATVTVAVAAGVSVLVNPQSVEAVIGDTVRSQFRAQVSGTTDGSVSWSIEEGAGDGTIDQNGAYFPPRTGVPLTIHVVATSNAEPSAKGTAIVHLWPDLLDHGGPVLASVTAYVVWWGDASKFAADDREVIEGFLKGLAGSPYLAGMDQYMRGQDASVTFGASFVGDTVPPDNFSQISWSDINDVACNALKDHGIPPATNTVVIIQSAAVNDQVYWCGEHAYLTCDGVQVPMAYLPSHASGTFCNYNQPVCGTTHSTEAMGLVMSTSHELLETMTDPFNNTAWVAPTGEVADKCGTEVCTTFATGTFSVTDYYSNQVHHCVTQ